MFRRTVSVVALSAILAACASSQQRYAPEFYEVKRGDTLYSIAFRFGTTWQRLAELNEIDAPYTIFVGNRLRITHATGYERRARRSPSRDRGSVLTQRIPEPSPRVEPRRSTREVAAIPRPTTPKPTPVTDAAKTSIRPTPVPTASTPTAERASGGVRWRWPTDGRVISGFSAGGHRKGVDIGGEMGQSIVAAADGTVVYSGDGLVGYGELIIIKHTDSLLSAYGHNRKRLVAEGDAVTGGQRIAEMGSTGTDRPLLHFEIRVDGRPTDPTALLPQR